MTDTNAKKPRVRMPRYRLHRPSGQAVVTLAEKDHYLGKHGSKESKVAYQRVIAQWLAGGAPRRRQPAAEAFTIKDLVAAWWQHIEAKVEARHGDDLARKKHVLGEARHPLRPLVRLYGDTLAAAFGPKDLKTLRKAMLDSGTVCRGTVNRRIQGLRRMFRWGVSEQLLPPSLAHSLEAVDSLERGELGAHEGRRVLPVAFEHVEAVLPHVSRQVAALILLQWWSGMRSGEAVTLKPCNLDRSGKVWVYRPDRHKTEHHGRSREIHLGPRAQEVLLPFLNRIPQPDTAKALLRPDEAEAERNTERSEQRKTPRWPSHMRRNARIRVRRRARAPRSEFDVHAYRRAIARAVDVVNVITIRRRIVEVVLAAVPGCQKETLVRAISKLQAKSLLDRSGGLHLESARLEAMLAGVVHGVESMVTGGVGNALALVTLVPRWHPHQLRHAAATRLRKEHGLEAARVVLGHVSPVVTGHYAEVDGEKAKIVMGQLG